MTLLADWLLTLGAASLGALWVPLLAWTAVAFAAMSLLRLWRSAHTLVHYAARTALLLALPLGLFLAAVTDLSILALFPSPAETPIAPIFILPLMDFNPEPGAPAAPAWTLYHLLGLLTVLAGVLGAGRLHYLARHALALTRFRRCLPYPDAPIQQAIDRQATALGIQRRVRAVVTTQDIVPMTLGWLRPVIVVPEALTGDEEHLHMTLLHELIHIRRQDVLLQGVEYVIGALFLINPAVWLLRRSIGQYREMSCDAEVVTQPRVSSKRYAALLYRFASPPSFRRRLALSMSASDPELKKRILAMKSHLRPTHRWLSPKLIGFALAALLLTSATAFVACSDLVDSNIAKDEAAASKTNVLTVVEEMPELIGGLKAIQAELHYPKIAKEAGVEGRVIVQFVVNEEGYVVDPKIVRGLGSGLDEEALRVISQVRFKPGKQAGKAVSVKMSLPFTFKLDTSGTASTNVRILDGTLTITHPEMEPEEMNAFFNTLYEGLDDYRSQIKTLEEQLQNAPSATEKVSIEAALKELRQQVKEHIQGRFEEIEELEEQLIKGQNRPAQTPEGTDEEIIIRPGTASIRLQQSPPSGEVIVAPPQTLSLGTMQIVGLRRTEIGLQGRVVVAETGEALVGATVLNRDKRIGTATDLDGNFVLNPDLTFRPIVFHRFGAAIDQSVSKDDDAGTGLAKKENDPRAAFGLVPGSVRLTSNGTTLQEDIDYLVDYQAGTVTITNSSYLGKGRDIEIDYEPNTHLDSQGQKQMNALEAGENPLYLVDGTPTPGNTRPDPKQLDIESISVLKGAAARALYGARAAHGVVEITTVQDHSEH